MHYRPHYGCGYYVLFIMWTRCYQCLTENPVTSQYLQSIYITIIDQYSHQLSATNYQSSMQFLYNLTVNMKTWKQIIKPAGDSAVTSSCSKQTKADMEREFKNGWVGVEDKHQYLLCWRSLSMLRGKCFNWNILSELKMKLMRPHLFWK